MSNKPQMFHTESISIINSLVPLHFEPNLVMNLSTIGINSVQFDEETKEQTVTFSQVAVDAEGKAIRIVTDDGRIGDLKGTRGSIQYLKDEPEDSDFYTSYVSELIGVTGEVLELTYNPSNYGSESCFLNYGLGRLLSNDQTEILGHVSFNCSGKSDKYNGEGTAYNYVTEVKLNLPVEQIEKLIAEQALLIVQYTLLVPKDEAEGYAEVVTETINFVEGEGTTEHPIYGDFDTLVHPVLSYGQDILIEASGETIPMEIIVDTETNTLYLEEHITGAATIQYLTWVSVVD